MLKKNIDLTVYDPVKARAQFLGLMKHKPSFMPTKPKLKRSLTMDRLLSNRPKKKRKVEYKNRSPSPDEFFENLELLKSPFSSKSVNSSIMEMEDALQFTNSNNTLSSINHNYTQTSNSYEELDCNIPKSKEVEKIIKYCICDGKESFQEYIGCNRRNQCQSRLLKLKSNIIGGDWFHLKCVGFLNPIIKNYTWFCNLCDQLSFLKIQLYNVGRKIQQVRGDGNCLYRCLALHKFGNSNKHSLVRNSICAKLKQLFEDSKYKNIWLDSFNDSDEFESAEHQLVRDLARFHKEVFNISEGSFLDNDKKAEYLRYMSTPGNYGNSIDLGIFSLLEQKTIWVLQDTKSKTNPSFKWQLTHAYINNSSFDDNINSTSYVALLYSNPTGNTNNAHYDLISPLMKSNTMLPPPSPSVDIKIH